MIVHEINEIKQKIIIKNSTGDLSTQYFILLMNLIKPLTFEIKKYNNNKSIL